MKNKIYVSLTFILMFIIMLPTVTYSATNTYGKVYGKVVKVADGNAFILQTLDNEKLTVQIAGIDTSESTDAYEFLQAFLEGKNITINIIPISSANLKPYSYAIVTYNNIDLANHMLRNGLGKYDSTTVTSNYRTNYFICQRAAINNNLGVWNK